MSTKSKKVTVFIFSLLFAVAYSQSPLFTSNQNQYFLHGSAQAGLGCLSQDWLANTFDPTPLFSYFVRLVTQFTHPVFFYLVYAALLGIYLWALVEIIFHIRDSNPSRVQNFLFLSILLVVHSAGWRFFLSRIFSDNWAYIIEDGFADQRLLGPVLQPSAFGVLLLVSIVFFLQNKSHLAVFFSALAASIHPTYLLSAASLTISYLLALWIDLAHLQSANSRRRKLGSIISTASLSLVFVFPILVYTYVNFGNTSASISALARSILVEVRIPHHALLSNWFDATAIFKILWISIAIFSVRKSRLYFPLLISWTITVLLTIIQFFTHSTFLALLFPWRLSTFLMPIATAVLVEKFCTWIFVFSSSLNGKKVTTILSGFLVLLALIGGIYRQVTVLQNQANATDRPMMAYVKQNSSCGSLFLVPPKMQDFRLATGQSIYVDFKSIPYRAEDVIEWNRRYLEIDNIYHQSSCTPLKLLSSQALISHVVLPSKSTLLDCIGGIIEYQDPYFSLVRLDH